MKKEILLTKVELQEMAEQLGDLQDDIRLMAHSINMIPSAESDVVEENPLTMYAQVHDYLGAMFYKFQKIDDLLGHYSFLLYEATDEIE